MLAQPSAREGYLGLLDTVSSEFPACRLLVATRAMPPLVSWPPGLDHLTLFTDATARHTACPHARLTYWSVVQARAEPTDLDTWMHLSPAARAATFSVLCMAGTPGEQTVPRAELAAVSWVATLLRAHPGKTATVYSDCQYVVDLCGALRLWSVHSPAARALRNLDLARPMLGLAALTVYKVKAHNPLTHAAQADSFLRWTTAGNEAADAAARVAKQQDSEFVQRVSDDIAVHSEYEYSHMVQYAQYLVEVNLLDSSLRAVVQAEQGEPDDAASDQEQEIRLLEGSGPGGEWTPLVPACPQPCLMNLVWGDDFMLTLYSWAQQLQWPVAPHPVMQEDGVTYLELFTHFVVWSNLIPPAEVPTISGRKFVPSRSLLAKVQPRTLEATVGTMVEACQFLRRSHGLSLLPAARARRLHHLRPLGLKSVQLGLNKRPLFPPADGWILLLRRACAHHTVATFERHVAEVNEGAPFSLPAFPS